MNTHPLSSSPLSLFIDTANCLQSWQQSLEDARHRKAEINIRYGKACSKKTLQAKKEARELCSAGESALREIERAEAKVRQLATRLAELLPDIERELKALSGEEASGDLPKSPASWETVANALGIKSGSEARL